MKPLHASPPPKARPREDRTAASGAESALFTEAFAYVRHVLRRFGVPEAERDDLAQEVLIAVYAKRQEYDSGRGSPRQWLYGFVVNFLRNHRRGKSRRKGQRVELSPDLANKTPTAEEQFVAEQLRRLLHEELFPQVEFDLLTVVIAREIEEFDFKAIAEQQEIPLSTVHDRYQRGIGQLRAAYERHQRKQKAQGLAVMPLALGQLLAADRVIPDAPAELARRSWKRVQRALRWRARWRALWALLHRPETHLAATFLAGGVLGSVLTSLLRPVPQPAPIVFVQPTPVEPAPVVAVGPDAPMPAESALPVHSTSSEQRRDPGEEKLAFEVAYQAFVRGHLDRALAALKAHERDYPAGEFAAEREVLRARIVQLRDAGGL
ncbi:MAG: RNA polymerase sigma factor [Byssovorax sp.]